MMECITVSDVINVSVEEVWKKISAFDEFSDYHPGAVRSFYRHQAADQQGSIRRVEMSDGYVEELLVNIDPKNYHLEYSILKSSFPLDGYSAEIKLIPVTQDNRTFIQWNVSFTTTHPSPEALVAEIKNNVLIAGINGLNDYFSKS